MAVATTTLTEKYDNLSETNQQTIFYMAKLMVERNSKEFETGQTKGFLDKVAKDIEVNKPTVQRLYYAYITKLSMEELSELAKRFGCFEEVPSSENTSNFNQDLKTTIEIKEGEQTKQKITFNNRMIEVHNEEDKFFFVLDELLDVLPISRNNKALKNTLSIKSRKLLEIKGEKVQAIETDKVKAFLQNFIRQLTEGKQKDEIRMFLEKVHQLSVSGSDIFAEPVLQQLKPIPNEQKVEIKPVELKIIREEATENIEMAKEIIKEATLPAQQPFHSFQEVKEQIKKTTSLLNIDEEKEIKSLTKMLNDTIGYLSNEAKLSLHNLVKTNGLVETTVATIEMLNAIHKDTSLYFVNKINEHFTNLKDEIKYVLTKHAVQRAKERANATPEELLKMTREAAFYAETQTKKYVQYKDYIIVLGKETENENTFNIVTLLRAEWFENGIIMQEQIDRHA